MTTVRSSSKGVLSATISQKIKGLEDLIEDAPNALEEGKKFIQSFVDDWYSLYPFHSLIFSQLAKKIAKGYIHP